MSKEIKLTQGKTAIVDDEDYERLITHKWHAARVSSDWYAARAVYEENKKKKTVYMHREVLQDKAKGFHVDHINGNTLDNRKSNLRIATRSQNMQNRKRHSNNQCEYKGVYQSGNKNKWLAKIKSYYLGTFENAIDAARAYDAAAKALFGDFARLNFPNGAK